MTTVKKDSYQRELDKGNPNTIADVLRAARLGRQLQPIKVVFAGLSPEAAAIDITTAASKALSTITGIDLDTGENLPAIGQVLSLRVVTSATAATSVGSYGMTDAGGTAIVPPGGASAALGIAKISDDGKTITFPNAIAAFTLQYLPRAAVNMTDTYSTFG